MLWLLAGLAFLVFALKASEHGPLNLPRIRRLGRDSVAKEAVEHLAQSYGIPRHEVVLVGEGYDRKLHETWAWVRAPYRGGQCSGVTTKPDGAPIHHEHYCNVSGVL